MKWKRNTSTTIFTQSILFQFDTLYPGVNIEGQTHIDRLLPETPMHNKPDAHLINSVEYQRRMRGVQLGKTIQIFFFTNLPTVVIIAPEFVASADLNNHSKQNLPVMNMLGQSIFRQWSSNLSYSTDRFTILIPIVSFRNHVKLDLAPTMSPFFAIHVFNLFISISNQTILK
jgi:hypothetical protein